MTTGLLSSPAQEQFEEVDNRGLAFESSDLRWHGPRRLPSGGEFQMTRAA